MHLCCPHPLEILPEPAFREILRHLSSVDAFRFGHTSSRLLLRFRRRKPFEFLPQIAVKKILHHLSGSEIVRLMTVNRLTLNRIQSCGHQFPDLEEVDVQKSTAIKLMPNEYDGPRVTELPLNSKFRNVRITLCSMEVQTWSPRPVRCAELRDNFVEEMQGFLARNVQILERLRIYIRADGEGDDVASVMNTLARILSTWSLEKFVAISRYGNYVYWTTWLSGQRFPGGVVILECAVGWIQDFCLALLERNSIYKSRSLVVVFSVSIADPNNDLLCFRTDQLRERLRSFPTVTKTSPVNTSVECWLLDRSLDLYCYIESEPRRLLNRRASLISFVIFRDDHPHPPIDNAT